MASPSEILRVDSDASDEEIDRAYRERVKEAHPDQGGSAAEFLHVKAAYEQLIAGGPQEGAPRRAAEPGTTDAQQPVEPTTTVEYLNYDVLAEFGWSLADEDLFEKAADADLETDDYGRLEVARSDPLLESVESAGHAWPYACRGGACANCAVAVREGELTTPVNHVLPAAQTDRGIRLSCVGAPITDDLQVVYNVKHLPDLDELRLPPRPFEGTSPGD